VYDETIYNSCARARFVGCTYLRNIILALNTVYITVDLATASSQNVCLHKSRRVSYIDLVSDCFMITDKSNKNFMIIVMF
jgi:hypothetical protein